MHIYCDVARITKLITSEQRKVFCGGAFDASWFDTFFADNLIDPAAISDEYAHLVPPDYAATYDPSGGNIVKDNRFVRNMASVLLIDPSRIAVVNIVVDHNTVQRPRASIRRAHRNSKFRQISKAIRKSIIF